MDEQLEVTETVRRRYAELAVLAPAQAVCCGPGDACFGSTGYSAQELQELPEAAANASLGCGNPTAMAAMSEGDVILDLGSGGGIDVILSARRVGPTGRVYGLDMTDEMLDLARRNASDAGVENVEFLKGRIEAIPLPDAAVDVVISNCVINLSPDKRGVLQEVARVLRPGGRFAVSDVIADADMDEATRKDMEQWTGCVAGALTADQYTSLLNSVGLTAVQGEETHRVHPQAGSAIIRALKPAP